LPFHVCERIAYGLLPGPGTDVSLIVVESISHITLKNRS
jgi:hypothetical protein